MNIFLGGEGGPTKTLQTPTTHVFFKLIDVWSKFKVVPYEIPYLPMCSPSSGDGFEWVQPIHIFGTFFDLQPLINHVPGPPRTVGCASFPKASGTPTDLPYDPQYIPRKFSGRPELIFSRPPNPVPT